MGARLAFTIEETEAMAYVRLAGVIDEDNGLNELTKRIKKPTVVINTADVERINSCGVRDWVTWLGELTRGGAETILAECSPAIMTQVNLVNNFVGAGTIKSFYAPYFCSSCNTDKMLLVEVDEALETQPFRPPTCRCDQCDHTMEFDDIESSYFAFLGSMTRDRISPEVKAAIRGFAKDPKLRERATASTAAASIPSSVVSRHTPTAPSSKILRSILSESSVSFSPARTFPSPPASSTNKILIAIIVLLVVAIGLLAFVILRST
jgi:anti-anti-sigma regulatory factor